MRRKKLNESNFFNTNFLMKPSTIGYGYSRAPSLMQEVPGLNPGLGIDTFICALTYFSSGVMDVFKTRTLLSLLRG